MQDDGAAPNSQVKYNVSKDCGSECVMVFLANHGVNRSMEEIRAKCDPDNDGQSSLQDLAEVCREYGFVCTPGVANTRARPSGEAILRMRSPVLQNTPEHFVLVVETEGEYSVYIPPFGVAKWDYKQLSEKWDGYGLFFANTRSWPEFAVFSIVALSALVVGVVCLRARMMRRKAEDGRTVVDR